MTQTPQNRSAQELNSSPTTVSGNHNWNGTEWTPDTGEVSGRIRRASAEFTRPGDTTQYTARDVVCNSVGAPVLMAFDLGRPSGFLTKIRLVTNNKTTTARFRMWFYSIPNPAVAGDNSPMTLLWANRSNRLGYVDLPPMGTEDAAGSDSASALATAGTSASLPFAFLMADGVTTLYALLETLDVFSPASGQAFFVELTADCN